MLQFIALAITFVAIYRQLRTQHIQIRDNTKLLRSQAHNNAVLLGSRPLEMLIENDGLASIVTVGYATPEALNEVEWARFGNYTFLQVNAWEYFYYQHRDDSIPKELWVGADAYSRSLVQTKPGLSRFWSEFQGSYDEPFRSYVAGEFAKKPQQLRPAVRTEAESLSHIGSRRSPALRAGPSRSGATSGPPPGDRWRRARSPLTGPSTTSRGSRSARRSARHGGVTASTHRPRATGALSRHDRARGGFELPPGGRARTCHGASVKHR